MKVCGINNYQQLGVESNSTGDYKGLYACPPINSKIDIESIMSYSIYSTHSILIANDGRCFAFGYNGDGRIDGNYSNDPLNKKEIEIFDPEGNKCTFISAVCGDPYTLYLVSSPICHKRQLVYAHSYKKIVFINTTNNNPTKLFGGNKTAAAVTENGSIIIINSKIVNDASNNEITSTYLPENEKAASLACCEKFIAAISESGKLFIAFLGDEFNQITFQKVSERAHNKFISVSGTHSRCFAISNDGRVFGYSLFGFKDFGMNIDESRSNEFIEITPLKSYKIISASSGNAHSLFVTIDGKVIACGFNADGQLFTKTQSINEYINQPMETCIRNGAHFCIAGCNNSVAFINHDIPPNSPNSGKSNVPFESDRSNLIEKLQREIFLLNEENSRLKDENMNLRDQISHL